MSELREALINEENRINSAKTYIEESGQTVLKAEDYRQKEWNQSNRNFNKDKRRCYVCGNEGHL